MKYINQKRKFYEYILQNNIQIIFIKEKKKY